MDKNISLRDGLEVYDPEQVRDVEKYSYDEIMARLSKMIRDAELDAWLRERVGGGDDSHTSI